jgi:hypothetical protein
LASHPPSSPLFLELSYFSSPPLLALCSAVATVERRKELRELKELEVKRLTHKQATLEKGNRLL